MADNDNHNFVRRSVRKVSQNSYIKQRTAQTELREKVRKVSKILRKPEHERSCADKALVKRNPDVVKTSQKNEKRLQESKDRILEIEDEPSVLAEKCESLAELIRSSEHVVVYTGAGISTAASIPDYRGPNGVWTLLRKGQELCAQDLSDAEPTYTHMSLVRLFRAKKVKYVVSQNCDGLHMRSGFPRSSLSELHGNMYIEMCYNCAPHKEYVRLFDVTERTSVRRHATARRCRACGVNLADTIVHFGEKGKILSPYRWKEAVRAAKKADLILCLGSSLKVLKKYACLWCMDKKPQFRPKLAIVNLQWTPKDDVATLKINGRCDDVLRKVMELLEYDVPGYQREMDPIFRICSPLRANETKTTSKKILIPPEQLLKPPRQSSKTKVQQRFYTEYLDEVEDFETDSKNGLLASWTDLSIERVIPCVPETNGDGSSFENNSEQSMETEPRNCTNFSRQESEHLCTEDDDIIEHQPPGYVVPIEPLSANSENISSTKSIDSSSYLCSDQLSLNLKNQSHFSNEDVPKSKESSTHLVTATPSSLSAFTFCENHVSSFADSASYKSVHTINTTNQEKSSITSPSLHSAIMPTLTSIDNLTSASMTEGSISFTDKAKEKSSPVTKVGNVSTDPAVVVVNLDSADIKVSECPLAVSSDTIVLPASFSGSYQTPLPTVISTDPIGSPYPVHLFVKNQSESSSVYPDDKVQSLFKQANHLAHQLLLDNSTAEKDQASTIDRHVNKPDNCITGSVALDHDYNGCNKSRMLQDRLVRIKIEESNANKLTLTKAKSNKVTDLFPHLTELLLSPPSSLKANKCHSNTKPSLPSLQNCDMDLNNINTVIKPSLKSTSMNLPDTTPEQQKQFCPGIYNSSAISSVHLKSQATPIFYCPSNSVQMAPQTISSSTFNKLVTTCDNNLTTNISSTPVSHIVSSSSTTTTHSLSMNIPTISDVDSSANVHPLYVVQSPSENSLDQTLPAPMCVLNMDELETNTRISCLQTSIPMSSKDDHIITDPIMNDNISNENITVALQLPNGYEILTLDKLPWEPTAAENDDRHLLACQPVHNIQSLNASNLIPKDSASIYFENSVCSSYLSNKTVLLSATSDAKLFETVEKAPHIKHEAVISVNLEDSVVPSEQEDIDLSHIESLNNHMHTNVSITEPNITSDKVQQDEQKYSERIPLSPRSSAECAIPTLPSSLSLITMTSPVHNHSSIIADVKSSIVKTDCASHGLENAARVPPTHEKQTGATSKMAKCIKIKSNRSTDVVRGLINNCKATAKESGCENVTNKVCNKKPKCVVASLPGWFGKGLGIKKKKK